jgi:hypothetical protein
MKGNPKTNYTDDDIKTYLTNVFVRLIMERDHPEILKKAEKLTHKFLKQNVDK